MNRHNLPLSYLRAFVTVLVLAHHSVLAYVAFAPRTAAPFPMPPYVWSALPVVDSRRWAGFDLFVLFNDAFFMSLMFFLSGLFVWGSISRKGSRAFLRDRFLRLGVPFLVVAVFLMPLAYYPAYLQTAVDPAFPAYLRQWRLLDYWPSGPCWFIAALLAFDVLAVLLRQSAPGLMNAWGRLCGKSHDSPVRFFLAVLAACILAHLTMGFVFGPVHWFTYGPLAIQASRAVLYPLVFFLGVGIGMANAEQVLPSQDSRLARRWPLWLVTALIAFALLVIGLMALKTAGMSASGTLRGLAGVALVLSCGATSVFMLAAFIRFGNRSHPIMESLSRNAYGMYLVHYVCVTWTQYALLHFPLPAIGKGAIVFGATLLFSWATVAAMRRVPLIDRILSNGAIVASRGKLVVNV